MNHDEFSARFKELLKELGATVAGKNANYATLEHPFANFVAIENLSAGKISATAGLLTRMSDKLGRLAILLTSGAANNFESIDDNLMDLGAYALLTRVYLESLRKTQEGIEK